MSDKYEAYNDELNTKLMRRTLYGIMLAVLIAVIWSIFAKIDNYAKTTGEVVPVSDIQQIQSLEGGRIEEILVLDGDIVEQGQAIILFDPIHASTGLKRLESKAAGLILRAERLRAFAQENDPDFSEFKESFTNLVQENNKALNAERQELDAEIEQINSELANIKAELHKINRKIPPLLRNLKATREMLEMYEGLYKKHASSKKELLMMKKQEANISKEYEELLGQKNVIEEQINGFDEKIAKIKKAHFADALDRRTQSMADLGEVSESIIESKDKLKRRKIASPISGIIKSIPHTKIGTVISPGGVVAEIVPIDTEVVIEVKIPPQDIGFMKIGLKSIIKLDAYDYSRYGSVYGELITISPTTFTDPKRAIVYYKGRVKPNKNYVGKNPKENIIIPGMTAEVDIITDQQTVFQALVKPVYTAMKTAFRSQ